MPRKKMTQDEKDARKKLRDAEKVLEKEAREAKQKIRNLDNRLNEIKYEESYVKSSPTYFFEPGERVEYGRWENVHVVTSSLDGRAYLIHIIDTRSEQGNLVEVDKTDWVKWIDLRKYRTHDKAMSVKSFAQEDDIRLSFSQRQLGEILSSHYHFGYDYEASYQRPYVWKLPDKIALIKSIWNNIDIGKFVFIQLPFKEGCCSYEILDGKQRLLTLIDFQEDRFAYEGLTFSELNRKDQYAFKNTPVSYAHIENVTKEQKLRYFLKLNTTGVPQDSAHLEKVKAMWEKSAGEKG